MKAEEWLTYFMKIYGRRPKMTEVDEAIQNGSLLANRAEVEAPYCQHLKRDFGKA